MGVSVEDLTDGPELDVRMVPLERIRRNPANPNRIREDLLDTLRDDIRAHGFTQPILVRPVEGDAEHDFELIDGEHRHRVMGDLGASQIPAVVWESDETDAALRLLTMNRLRGQFIPIKLAHLLVRLSETIDEKDLRKRLGMEPEEFRDSLRLASFGLEDGDVAEKVREAVSREQAEAPVTIAFVLSQRDATVVERVIASIAEGGSSKQERGKALVKIAREYEKAAKNR